nr:SPFH domain-containing protein [Gemmatimonadota bacterium]
MYRERPFPALHGLITLVVHIVAAIATGWFTAEAFMHDAFVVGGIHALLFIAVLIGFGGFFIVHPNEAKALVLFGTYKGTVKKDGFWWANPFMTKQAISLRVRNFETAKLKVNDNHAN